MLIVASLVPPIDRRSHRLPWQPMVATRLPGSSRWKSTEYCCTYPGFESCDTKSMSPPAPVSRPSELPCGGVVPFGNGSLSVLKGVNPPSGLVSTVVDAEYPREPIAASPVPAATVGTQKK